MTTNTQYHAAEMAAPYADDLPYSLAVAAFSGTSWTPERRADQHREDYANTLKADHAEFAKHAAKGGTLDMLEAEFARYRAGYAAKYRAWLHSYSRCISWGIIGPSNFPVRRAQKRSDVASKRLKDLIDFRAKAKKSVIRTLRPDLRPIMAGDSDAIARLEEKLVALRSLQDRMKAVNAAHKNYLKNPDSLLTADLSEREKEQVRSYAPAYSWEPHPFAPYQLTNNNATIRMCEQRLEQLRAAKTEQPTEIESSDGIRLEDCPADNRVRLFFPGKPGDDVRARLKSSGFRWAPTVGAWQAYRNPNSLTVARSFVGEQVIA